MLSSFRYNPVRILIEGNLINTNTSNGNSPIIKLFLQSKIFSPTGPWFISVLRLFVDRGVISLETIQEEIQEIHQYGDQERINQKTELEILKSLLPQVVQLAEIKYQGYAISDVALNKYAWYVEIDPFQDRTLQLKLLAILFPMQSCYKYASNYKWASTPIESGRLEQYHLSKDDLIDVSSFKVLNKGFQDNVSGDILYPHVPFHLYKQIMNLVQQTKKAPYDNDIKLSLLPRYIGNSSEYSSAEIVQYDRIFGMPFTAENLKKVFGKQHGTLRYSFCTNQEETKAKFFYAPLKELQYVVKFMDNDHISLSIEEIIDSEKKDYQSYSDYVFQCEEEILVRNRYVHAIFERTQLSTVHLDLSYLFYNSDAYTLRANNHIKDKVVNATIKRKMFRVDGHLGFEDFKDILAACFHQNPEIVNLVKGS